MLCPRPPLTGAGKPELLAAEHVDAFRAKWPDFGWSVLAREPGSWPFDAIVAHGVVHNHEVIKSSGVPWVAVDHLHENAWWYLTGHREFWKPWRLVCLSGVEESYLDTTDEGWTQDKMIRTGYTAFDTAYDPEAIREEYGLPKRYLLVGTAVQASTITGARWRAYFRGGLWKGLGRYRGPSYAQVLHVLRDYARATGMAVVGKGRWKHEDHWAHRFFDHYFTDEPTDPARAWKLMRGATVYAGGISGLAVEALAARVPTINWAYYQPLLADHMGFRKLRADLWIAGIWEAIGIGRLFRVHDPDQWKAMVEYLDTVGPHWHYAPDDRTSALVERVIGSRGASGRVLEVCGL